MNQMTNTPDESVPPQRSLLAVWRERIAYQGASLGIVCAVVAILLLAGNLSTHEQIAKAQLEDQLAVLRQVLPVELYDNNPLAEAVTLEDAELGAREVYPARLQGKLTAVAFKISTIGYGGPIEQLMAIDMEGRILGVRVLKHKETPGLADKIERARSAWITVFDGLSLSNTPRAQWAVKKDGGRFDQFAGATITPRAVVKGVLQGLDFHARQAAVLAEQETK